MQINVIITWNVAFGVIEVMRMQTYTQMHHNRIRYVVVVSVQDNNTMKAVCTK